MSRNTNVPFFPLPPKEYSQEYMNRVVESFSTYLRRMQNPGEGRNTRTVLTNVPTSPDNQEAGMVYNDNTVLRIKSGTASENTSGLPVPQFTNATLPAVEEGTIIYDSDPDDYYSKGLRVSDGVAWNYMGVPYETGYYTATLTPSTSGSITLFTGQETLSYTRIGRLVFVGGQLAIASTSAPSGTLQLNVPYLTAGGPDRANRFAGPVALQQFSSTYVGVDHNVHVTDSSTGGGVSYVTFLHSANNNVWVNVDARAGGAGDDLRVGFTYMTDEDT